MILKKLEMIMMIRKIYENNKGDKEIKMNKFVKIAMTVAIAAYVISPADIIGGPFDDILLMLLGVAANKKLNKNEKGITGKRVVETDAYEVY